MKIFIIVLIVIAAFAAFSLWNYRRFMPKPVPLGDKKYKAATKELCIKTNGKTLYERWYFRSHYIQCFSIFIFCILYLLSVYFYAGF